MSHKRRDVVNSTFPAHRYVVFTTVPLECSDSGLVRNTYLSRLSWAFGLNDMTLMPTESVNAPPKPWIVWYVMVSSTLISSPDHCESSDDTNDPLALWNRLPAFDDV